MTELDDKDTADIDRAGLARRWAADLEMAKKSDKDFIEAGRKIVKRYRDQRGISDNSRKYNILWSNVQTLAPAVYAKKPQAQVQRRFKDADPVGRCASQILERALQFEIDHYSDYDSTLKNNVLDRLLPGRGVAWVRFEPAEDAESANEEGEAQVTDDQSAESMGKYECSPCDYVFWEDFRHSPARTWEEVSWVARLVYMSKEEGEKRFGEVWKDVPLAHEPIGIEEMKSDGMAADQIDRMKKAKVWEIWDKSERKALWHAEGFQQILDVRDDPLGLEGFFPCPKPLYATLTTDTLCPVPDFKQYQDQAKEMDELTARIALLVKAVKVVGVYDASHEGIQRMMNEGVDNQLIPVSTWAMFAEKGGLKGAVDFMPIDMVLTALAGLYEAREQAKQIIYEITGLSDIIRGASVASETATAQKIKSQFASLRLKHLQGDVARFASDLLRMKAQIMCALYRPEVLVAMSSMADSKDAQYIPQAIELLQNDVLRAFRIEVATDSLVELDEAGEKDDRMEFLTAAGGFIREAIQAPPEMAPLLGEMLMFGVRSFKAGQSMEASLEQFIAQSAEKAKQPKPEQPNPEMLKLQAAQQSEQGRMQLEQAKMQAQMQADAGKLQLDMQLAEGKAQMDMQLEQMRLEQKATADSSRLEFERWKAELDSQTKLAIASMSAQASIDAKADEQTEKVSGEMNGQIEQVAQSLMDNLDAKTSELSQMLAEISSVISSPRKIVRGPDGRATGVDVGGVVRPIQRGPDGRAIGI